MKRTEKPSLSEQVKLHSTKKPAKSTTYEGNFDQMISTGSTLLDLAISGGRQRGGGIPGGILTEIFGPNSSGKTVILCEIAGTIQRAGGEVLFRDPEARLNKEYSRIFGMNPNAVTYDNPNTVKEVFAPIRKWNPPEGKIHGIIADSLAALSTEMEMEDKDGMGMRRAKEFSEELRKTCRVLADKNFLMVCSNQIRENLDAGLYGPKYRTPGGTAIGFYASLRLRCSNPVKLKCKHTVHGKECMRIVGIETEVEVYKNSVWKPYRTAPLTILFDYGIDDIRQNLQFVKDAVGSKTYLLASNKLSNSLEESCQMVEANGWEPKLKSEVIGLWEEIEHNFDQKRKPKHPTESALT